MEILQLKYFCDAAVCQNFSQTAQKFMIPPSCVSASVKRLEKELGVNLFDRSANKAVLNENGKKFLHATSLALNLLEGAVREIKTGEQAREIKLLVACNRRVVTSCIEKFRERNPDVSFSLAHHTDKSFFDFDMIISDTTIPEASEQILLFKEPMLLAVNRKNPLAKKPEILAKDLENEKFITMQKGSSLSRITEVLCAKAGFSPNISIESDDPYYIRK
ncbi:MAG: LysR family transcriptional regulator, partial [Clostridia bacterium]|nr:LysR family transcriptional regulator [Clostridia bacterium]